MKCEECGKETNDLIMGACSECANKIIQRIEKKTKHKKINFGEF